MSLFPFFEMVQGLSSQVGALESRTGDLAQINNRESSKLRVIVARQSKTIDSQDARVAALEALLLDVNGKGENLLVCMRGFAAASAVS